MPEAEEDITQNDKQIYLKRVHVENYRALESLDVNLEPGVNVIIGANNVGKSALLDAIRVALEVGKYRRTAFVRKWDFRDEKKEVKIDLFFHIPEELDGFHELLAMEDGKHELQIHVRFKLVGEPGNQRVMPYYWGGNHQGHRVDEQVLYSFHAEYLGALRDASTELKPNPVGPLAELLKKLRSHKDQREEIEDIFKKAHGEEKVRNLVGEAKGAIDSHIGGIALERDQFNVQLDPVPPEFEKLVGNFEMKLTNGERTSEVFQNGMGYNNILYISTVLGHIQQAKKVSDDEYYALLIEEPEAHLHPQLEDSLFAYICDLGAGSGAQIITTSHSPVIASECDLDDINILCGDEKTVSVAINSLGLDDPTKNKLTRFLDVTKSQLLFAKGIILVEGISEALLLPLIADARFGEKRSLVKGGVEVVNVGGVSFAPFAKLFNGDPAIPIKTSVVTDKDDYTDDKGNYHPMSDTASSIVALQNNFLKAFVTANRTFEMDMWNAGNSAIMKKVYESMHTQTTVASANDLITKLESNKDKAEFAQELAWEATSTNTVLKAPAYLQEALDWAMDAGNKDATSSTTNA